MYQNAKVCCKVCLLPTKFAINCGAVTCIACKKFFLRNRAKLAHLRCTSGTFNCQLSASPTSAVRNSTGNILRFMCPRCRLAKCYQVGMRHKGSSPTTNNDNHIINHHGLHQQQQTDDGAGSAAAVVNNSNNSQLTRNDEFTLLLQLLTLQKHPAILSDPIAMALMVSRLRQLQQSIFMPRPNDDDDNFRLGQLVDIANKMYSLVNAYESNNDNRK